MTTKRCTVQDPKGWACNHDGIYEMPGFDECGCHRQFPFTKTAAECAGQPVPTLLPLVTPCCWARMIPTYGWEGGSTYDAYQVVDGYECANPACFNQWDSSGEPVTTFTPTQDGDTK